MPHTHTIKKNSMHKHMKPLLSLSRWKKQKRKAEEEEEDKNNINPTECFTKSEMLFTPVAYADDFKCAELRAHARWSFAMYWLAHGVRVI